MDYMTLDDQGQANMLTQRIASLESHHFGLTMNMAELLADESVETDEPSNEFTETKISLQNQIEQMEARIMALKAMMPVVETPAPEPPVEETPTTEEPVTEEPAPETPATPEA